MSTQFISGDPGPVVFRYEQEDGDKDALVVSVRCPASKLGELNPTLYIPAVYAILKTTKSSDGDGMYTVRYHCINYGEQQSGEDPCLSISYTIEMAEVVTPLQRHPKITGDLGALREVTGWLATDESERWDSYHNPQRRDGTALILLAEEMAIKFARAYNAGIETYNRYLPVINKISRWRRVPGLSLSDDNRKVTGGTAAFSTAGSFEQPDIQLSGYDSNGWFKSKDSWTQHESKVWQRTEQWTWTPDGSNSEHAWIYGVGV